FFSSRSRHTRFSRDWSSDVCSSDLTGLGLGDDDLRGVVADGAKLARKVLVELPQPARQQLEPLDADRLGCGHRVTSVSRPPCPLPFFPRFRVAARGARRTLATRRTRRPTFAVRAR